MAKGSKNLYTATSTADKTYPSSFEKCGPLLNGVHGPASSIANKIGQRMHFNGPCYIFPTSPDRLRNPVDQLPGNAHSLGFIGHLEAHKQVDRLIRVWSEVCKKMDQPHLHIFGNGSMETSLKEQALKLGIGQTITFHGYEVDLNKIFSQISATIVMAKEGLSLTTVEALCAGRCIILPNDGAFPEIYGECKVATMFEPDAVDTIIADCIVNTLKTALNPSTREAARIFFEEHFSPEVVSGQLVKCYQDLLQSDNEITT
jgi:glycosyltransferase involved in cell wall biosynthesis